MLVIFYYNVIFIAKKIRQIDFMCFKIKNTFACVMFEFSNEHLNYPILLFNLNVDKDTHENIFAFSFPSFSLGGYSKVPVHFRHF